jgi:hypothetical protein
MCLGFKHSDLNPNTLRLVPGSFRGPRRLDANPVGRVVTTEERSRGLEYAYPFHCSVRAALLLIERRLVNLKPNWTLRGPWTYVSEVVCVVGPIHW